MKRITEKSNKTSIIEKGYFRDDGSGSNKRTTEEAQKYNKEITPEDIRKWKASQEFGQKAKPRGMNSFIVDKPKEEYQMDLFFMADQDVASTMKTALLMVDIFTKYTQVVFLKSKEIPDVLGAIKRCIDAMGGKPESIYSDEEGAFVSNEVQTYLKDINVRHIVTLSHAPVAERQIRTMKDMIYKRIEHSKKEWYEVVEAVLDTYNNKLVHSVSKMTPANAMKDSNRGEVKFNLELKAKHTRKYPTISIDDEVRIFKKKDKLDKDRISNWSAKKYKVIGIETSMGQQFLLTGRLQETSNPFRTTFDKLLIIFHKIKNESFLICLIPFLI